MHESAHTLAGLGDEYSDPFDYPDIEEPNTTRQTDRNLIKWKAWLDSTTPIPTPQTTAYTDVVGLFEGAHYHDTGWYRPQYDCTMRSYSAPFCAVCREALTLSFYQRVRPVDSYTPANSNVTLTTTQPQTFSLSLLRPETHSLSVQWSTNGVIISGATNSSLAVLPRELGIGTSTVQARVTDDTPFVRSDPTNLRTQTITWTVQASFSELELGALRWLDNNRSAFRVAGSAPQNVVIEGSTDLLHWTALSTNQLVNGQFDYTNTVASEVHWQFFRARTPP